jgi:hypothetical protein
MRHVGVGVRELFHLVTKQQTSLFRTSYSGVDVNFKIGENLPAGE